MSERQILGIAATLKVKGQPQLTSFKSILHYIDVTLTISTNFFLYFAFYLDVYICDIQKAYQCLIVQNGSYQSDIPLKLSNLPHQLVIKAPLNNWTKNLKLAHK